MKYFAWTGLNQTASYQQEISEGIEFRVNYLFANELNLEKAGKNLF